MKPDLTDESRYGEAERVVSHLSGRKEGNARVVGMGLCELLMPVCCCAGKTALRALSYGVYLFLFEEYASLSAVPSRLARFGSVMVDAVIASVLLVAHRRVVLLAVHLVYLLTHCRVPCLATSLLRGRICDKDSSLLDQHRQHQQQLQQDSPSPSPRTQLND